MLALTNLLGVLILFVVIAAGVFAGNALDRSAHRVGAWIEKNRDAHPHVKHHANE